MEVYYLTKIRKHLKIKESKSEKEILDKISNRDTITLNAVVDNTALRNGYYLREIGILFQIKGEKYYFSI